MTHSQNNQKSQNATPTPNIPRPCINIQQVVEQRLRTLRLHLSSIPSNIRILGREAQRIMAFANMVPHPIATEADNRAREAVLNRSDAIQGHIGALHAQHRRLQREHDNLRTMWVGVRVGRPRAKQALVIYLGVHGLLPRVKATTKNAAVQRLDPKTKATISQVCTKTNANKKADQDDDVVFIRSVPRSQTANNSSNASANSPTVGMLRLPRQKGVAEAEAVETIMNADKMFDDEDEQMEDSF